MATRVSQMFTFLVFVSVAFLAFAENTTLTLTTDDWSTDDSTNFADSDAEIDQPQPWRPVLPPPRSGTASGWGHWSEWSTCSRSCDGGVSHQLRRCNSQDGCRGEPVRYKICNMQPCPEHQDFRAHQCTAYNNVPYEGVVLQWSPHYEETEPCALTCRGYQTHGHDGEEDAEGVAHIVVQLSPRVQDGTRCRPGSLDMCIHGRCQRVGCDLRIGSAKKVDGCGVCGGDGSSCAQPLYHWEAAAMSLCSVTCGGGYKMSRPVCRNRVSGAEVEEQLCNASQRPEPSVVQCNTHKCPPKWSPGEWGACSTSCGAGTRSRTVLCVEEGNGTKTKVADHTCRGHKPRHVEPCGQQDCPQWKTGPWSGCSVSCGSGIRVRAVECRDIREMSAPNGFCNDGEKPPGAQPCTTGISCPSYPGSEDDEDDIDKLLPGVLYHTQPLIQPYPPAAAPAVAERLVGEQVVPSEATFIKDAEWGPCSVSCGEGFRKREVHCKIFLEFSRTIAKLPDRQCSGPKPTEETERCVMEPCSLAYGISDPAYPSDTFRPPGYGDSNIRVASGAPGKTYSWKEQGYTHCSASCLGGVQELIIHCVRDDNHKIASPYMCAPETKPENRIRTCNDHPCPPRWNYSDFQPCTKSCGIGIQTREVNCIHEVTRGGGNTVVVPNNMCPQPPPPDRQYCNVLDCPVRWEIGEWSKCSKPCGGGVKERKVECKQVMAQNHMVDRPDSLCPTIKPNDKKPCNTNSCSLSDKPQIAMSNSSYIQHDPKRKKVTLKIGGAATVFYGTQIKIKCPVKRFNRTRIHWSKDRHSYLQKSKKYKISKKGALRIQDLTYRDSGVYTCIAGKSTADLTLSVKSRPGVFPSSEEIERQNAHRDENGNAIDDTNDPTNHRSDGGHRPFYLPDDQSHEQPNPSVPKKQTGRNRDRNWPSPPPPPPMPYIPQDQHEQMKGDEVIIPDNGLDSWPPPQLISTTLVSDQEQEVAVPSHMPVEGIDTGNGGRSNDEPSTSSGTRPMPHFKTLLANLQNFGNSRGHRMVEDMDQPQSSPFHELSNLGAALEGSGDDDGLGPVVILGKGSPDNLKFDWMITEWSQCSQTCGGNGFQMRAAHCMVRLHNTTQNVGSNLCEDAGLDSPPTIQKCGAQDCPRWVVSEWTACDKSRCFTWNTAMQRREVSCQMQNSTDVATSMCNEKDKPPSRQECYNDKCKGVWRTDRWSECAASCDAQGIKYRILQCVWYGTKKPAGNACREQPRPSVMKVCKGPPCPDNVSDCRDHSKFCQNVKAMNMCRVQRYQHQCCQSCRSLA